MKKLSTKSFESFLKKQTSPELESITWHKWQKLLDNIISFRGCCYTSWLHFFSLKRYTIGTLLGGNSPSRTF